MATKVLIVDDASLIRLMLRKILTKNDYEVVGEAQNGKEAFDLYKELQPDIVTMDITMPVIDGINAVKMIREYDKNAKVIMCSALSQQSLVMEALKSGAKDYILKPFEEEKVIASINKIIENSSK